MAGPLQRQAVTIPLYGGVDAKTDPIEADQRAQFSATNGQYSSGASVSKRPGFTARGTVDNPTTIQATLYRVQDGLHKTNGYNVRSFGDASPNWNIIGPAGGGQLRLATALVPGIASTALDNWATAAAGDYVAHTALDNTGATGVFGVFQLSTGKLCQSSTTPYMCVATDGTNFYLPPSTGPYQFTKVPISAPNTSSTFTPTGVAVGNAWGHGDAVVIGNSLLVWSYNSGGIYTGLDVINLNTNAISTTRSWGAAGATTINACCNDTLFAAVVKDFGADSDFIAIGTPASPSNIQINFAAHKDHVAVFMGNGSTPTIHVYELDRTSTDYVLRLIKIQITGATTYTQTTIWTQPLYLTAGLFSRGFRSTAAADGRSYVWLNLFSTTQSQLLLYSSDDVIVGSALNGQAATAAYPTSYRPGSVAEIVTGNTSKHYMLAPTLDYTLDGKVVLNRLSIDICSPPAATAVRSGPRAYMSGAMPTIDTNNTSFEQGFLTYPEIQTYAQANVGGKSLTVGQTYQYCFVYSYTDDAGEWHRSAPGPVISVAITAGNNAVNFTIRPNGLTNRTKMNLECYRTVYSGSLMSTNFHFVGMASTDNRAAAFTFSEGLADATALSGALLYTTGGVVPSDPPPPLDFITNWRGRLWGIEQTNLKRLWFTKSFEVGVAAEWSAVFTYDVDSQYGNVIALAPMDDKLIIFQERATTYITGDGPTSDGTQGYFTDQQLIAAVYGLQDARSIVNTDNGVWFRDQRGLVLLGRDLSVVYAGVAVERLLASQTIYAACANAPAKQIYWFLGSSTLVFDTVYNRWSTWALANIVGAVVYQNVLHVLDSSGNLKQLTTAFTDAGSAYPLTVETAWLKPSGLAQGYVRIYRAAILGTYKSPHTLNVEICYDYNTTPAATIQWVPTSTPPYELRIKLPRQKCSAIKFKIYDSNQSGTFESCSLNEIALEFGVLPGLNRLPDSQSS